MKPKILLMTPDDPWLTNSGNRPSLGVLYIASYLREKGLAELQVLDMNRESENELRDVLDDFEPNVVGISMTTPQYKRGVELATLVKEHSPLAITVGGGPHATAVATSVPSIPDVLPKDVFDYVVAGDGMSALEDLCENGPWVDRVVKAKPMPKGRSLDWLPMPARDLVDMDGYTLNINGRKAQPIMTSFGCPYHCTFCSEPILNNRFRRHEAERAVDEMQHLKEEYGVEALFIYDDVFSIDAKRAMAIADLMIERGLDLQYRCTTRATDFVRHPGLLPKLRDSGCVEICLGTESGSDEVLKVNDKGMTVDTNYEAIMRIKNAGIKVLTYMITGLPGVSEESERLSYEFIRETRPDEIGHYLFAPFPSTPFWVNRQQYGAEIFEREIVENGWDIAQCAVDNEQVTCYLSYEKSGGLNRDEIKGLWLHYRQKYDAFMEEQGKVSIQQGERGVR